MDRKTARVCGYFRSPLFISAFLIYFSIFLGSIIRGSQDVGTKSFWVGFSRGETADFWMSFAIPLAIFQLRFFGRRYWEKTLAWSFGFVLLSGLASIFTPYRLARWISLGFEYPDGERLQHFAGGVLGIGTYLPIGLMNTHLTFGGLIGLLIGGYFLSEPFLGSIRGRFFSVEGKNRWIPGIVFFLFRWALLILSLILVFYNQSRSIWLGLLFSFGIFLYLIRKKNRTTFPFKKIFPLAIITLIIVGLFLAIASQNWLIRRSLVDLTQKKSTENQRYFIWKESFQIWKENPLLGVGNNQFRNAHTQSSERWLKENEWLWYEFFITPRGHAHHDFFHFLSVGGIFSGIFWLAFWFLNLKASFSQLYGALEKKGTGFSFGIPVLFIAGFFQCFQLDDEVALPFYAISGFVFGLEKKPGAQWGIIRIPLIFSFLALALSLVFWYFRTKSDPGQVHEKKIQVLSPSGTDYRVKFPSIPKYKKQFSDEDFPKTNTGLVLPNFEKLVPVYRAIYEGCLTHHFGNPIRKRTKPMLIHLRSKLSASPLLSFEETKQQSEIREKTQKMDKEIWIRIITRDRDCFDQDQEFRAHQTKPIGEIWKKWDKDLVGDSIISVKTRPDQDSETFPGSVRFRDFQVEIYQTLPSRGIEGSESDSEANDPGTQTSRNEYPEIFPEVFINPNCD